MNLNPSVDRDVVEHAYRALTVFGADLNRTTARLLLSLWRYRDSLQPADVDAVVERFPFLAESNAQPDNGRSSIIGSTEPVEYTRDTEPAGPLPERGTVTFVEITGGEEASQ